MVKVVLRNEFAFNMIYFNIFPKGTFVVPLLVSHRNGLKESVSKPETLILRHLFHIGMHKITTLWQHTSTHRQTDTHTDRQTDTHTHTHTHARTHARTYERTLACTRTHARTHARARTRARTRTHARTHARTHTRTHAPTHTIGRCAVLVASAIFADRPKGQTVTKREVIGQSVA